MENDLLYWVWLAGKLGAGSRRLHELLDRFGSAFEIYRADEETLTGFDCEGSERFHNLTDKNLRDANAILARCRQIGVDVITFADPRYPARLRAIQNPPTVLYCRGPLPDLNAKLCVAVVGTRKMSEYGCRAAYKISYGLASAGAVTVSGMALGVDSVVACASFAAGGSTVAVLGSGIDVIYPSRHRMIYEELVKHGTVMSEYPPGFRPTKYSFPARNRIISGLSQGTFVVEGDLMSGAMITARDALVQGRELFALPGNIGESNSKGTNSMIREGAHPVTSAADIIREFLPLYKDAVDVKTLIASDDLPDYDHTVLARYGVSPEFGEVAVKQQRQAEKKTERSKAAKTAAVKAEAKAEPEPKNDGSGEAYSSLEPGLRAVYDRLPSEGAVSVDKLTVEGLGIGEIIAALTMLELRGLVQSLPGGLYARM